MFVFLSSSYHLTLSYASTTANLKIVLMTPKKSLLKSIHPKKNTWQIFQPKTIPEIKISNPKNPSIIPVTWNPEHLLTDFFSFSAANTLNPSITPYPVKRIEAPPFLSPLKTPYKDV